MEAHLQIFNRVGKVLIVVGILDIAFMIYCIFNQMSYSSSFNIFAVIAGIFLLKGSFRSARIVGWLSALFLTFVAGSILTIPIWSPLTYWLTYLQLKPLTSILNITFFGLLLFLIFWLYKNLNSEPVLSARKQNGLKASKPIVAFILGGVAAAGLFSMMYGVGHSETGAVAITKAKEKTGPGYNYFLTNFNISYNSEGKYVRAIVAAYNDKEIKNTLVQWKE